jgi:gas vesicle protein
MKKTNNGGTAAKVLGGAAAGIALAVAASMFLSSKKGQELKGTVEEMTADFYKKISPQLKKVKKMGEKEYKVFMKAAAEKYAKAKKMSEESAQELIKNAEQSWKHFSKHLEI